MEQHIMKKQSINLKDRKAAYIRGFKGSKNRGE